MEASWWVVPLGNLHRSSLVTYVDNVESVCPAVSIIVVRYWIQFAVRQFVVNKDPVIVLSDLDVNHPSYLGIVGRQQNDVIRVAYVEDLELVVARNICKAATSPIAIYLAVLVEVPFDSYLGVIPWGRSDILEFLTTGPPSGIIELRRRLDVAIAIQVVVVNEDSVLRP